MVAARHRTEVRRRTGASPIVDSKAEAVAELMLEVAQCFFRIQGLWCINIRNSLNLLRFST
jgi:hypothetical protein